MTTRALNKLNDTAIKKATFERLGGTKKLSDGGGMYLHVQRHGRYWRLKYRFDQKERTLALGVYPDVSLKQARARRDEARQLLAEGIDPQVHRAKLKQEREARNANTFEAVARDWFETIHKPRKEATYTKKNWNRLRNHVFPLLAKRPIAEIQPPEVLEVLRRIERKGYTDNAHRVKGLISNVFRYAVSEGRANSDVTRDLRGVLASAKPEHFAALATPDEVIPLLKAMEGYRGQPTTWAALQLSALLFTRPGELRTMRWSDVDLTRAQWIAPKTKNNTSLMVPLANQAISLLEELLPLTGRFEFVFTGSGRPNRPMSENTVNLALKTLGFEGQMTAHGFRAMARTMLVERLGYPENIVEMQLDHKVPDVHGRAYNRAQWIEERQEMMQRWADYLDELKQT
ncbi:integrase [Halovibrio salipaludis]|uniref:Integrase n=1 Tax=Halovibrio salipaludis TaxID=2032626 RepID=A0A2A2EXH8_9GAMM|nr:integrase arm-type DNA-binding domain-containing protein [Halovibrio salipaludis]PAU77062.1 integrase [Halovibrio salipaludis]